MDINTLKFTKVITNIGQHYSTEKGQFTCEYPGIYVFLINVLKENGVPFVRCDIRKNNVKVVRAASDPEGESENGSYSSSTSAVIHMEYGDIAHVHCPSGLQSLNLHCGASCVNFSGILIKAD